MFVFSQKWNEVNQTVWKVRSLTEDQYNSRKRRRSRFHSSPYLTYSTVQWQAAQLTCIKQQAVRRSGCFSPTCWRSWKSKYLNNMEARHHSSCRQKNLQPAFSGRQEALMVFERWWRSIWPQICWVCILEGINTVCRGESPPLWLSDLFLSLRWWSLFRLSFSFW